MTTALLVLAIAATAAFAFMNGKNDAPHTFAPPIRTGALSPRIAVFSSALWTAAGALLSVGWARDLAAAVDFPAGDDGLLVIASSALGAAVWAVIAAGARMPTSSTHALMGAIAGASLAAQLVGSPGVSTSRWFLLTVVLLPLVLSPWIAFALAYGVANGFTLVYRGRSAHAVHRGSRIAQSIVATLFAVAHGIQDGQRTVFLLTAAFLTAGVSMTTEGLWGITAASAFLLGLGAIFGAWGIGRTLSHRMTRLDPLSASIGSGTAAGLLLLGGMAFHWPLSSTQLSAAALIGAAEASPFKPTRWRTVGAIVLFWGATPLGAGLLGGFAYLALTPVLSALG